MLDTFYKNGAYKKNSNGDHYFHTRQCTRMNFEIAVNTIHLKKINLQFFNEGQCTRIAPVIC